jgi:hypothetical protein
LSPFDISVQEAQSFEGGFFRFTTIAGPIRLVRFSDSGRGVNGRLGRFWLYGSEVAEILSAGPSGKHLVKEVSQRWAVCDDWGDKGLVWFMDVPRGQAVPACWGATKFQPKVSAVAQDKGWRQTRRSYAGGSIQLVIPVIDTGRNPDPWLLSMISGPIPTDKLVTAADRFLPA